MPTKQVLDRVGEEFRQDLRVQWRARGAAVANHSRISADYGCNQIRAGGAAHGAGCAGRWPGVLRRGGEATVRDLTCVRGAKLPACAELS